MPFVSSPNVKCQSVGLSLKECVTSALTHEERFSGTARKFSSFEE